MICLRKFTSFATNDQENQPFDNYFKEKRFCFKFFLLTLGRKTNRKGKNCREDLALITPDMQSLFPEIWSEDIERADELRHISVEVLSDWAEYAPLLKYLRAAEVHTLADVALLRPEDIADWHGIGPSRSAMFVRLIGHVTDRAGDFINRTENVSGESRAEALEALSDVPLSMLLARPDLQMLCRPLINAGISTMADFLALGATRLSRIRDIGKSRRVRMEALRIDIIVHHDEYIRQWQEFRQQHAYPISHLGDDSVLTLTRFEETILALIADFEPFDQKLGRAIRLYYKEGRSIEAVAKSCQMSVRSLRQMLDTEFVLPLTHGYQIKGFSLRKVFIRQLASLRQNLLYRPLPSKQKDISHIVEDFLSLETCIVGKDSPAILVATGEKRIGMDTIRIFIACMGRYAGALRIEELLHNFSALAARRRASYSETIATTLVQHYPWIEKIYTMDETPAHYRMSASHLTDNVARLHRIILDAGRAISDDEILRRYVSLYGKDTEEQIQKLQGLLRSLPRRVKQLTSYNKDAKTIFSFVPISTPSHQSLSDIIPALIERLGYEFTLSQMEIELARFGYTHQNLQTLHNLITQHCCSDMDFIHHYCHKAHTDEHPDVRWRTNRKRSVSMMIRDYVRSILRERPTHTMPLSDMLDELTAYTRLKGCSVRDIKARLFAFTAPNIMVAEQQQKPFYFDTHEFSIEICLK